MSAIDCNSLTHNYELYQGSLSKTEYQKYLNSMRGKIGHLINVDPRNHTSDIGHKIFRHLLNTDLSSAIAFTRISKGLYERAQRYFFTPFVRKIVLKHIKLGTGYKDFFLEGEGGWDVFETAAKLALVATTLATAIKSGIHAGRIPKDAPRKTITQYNEYGDAYEVTVIDHPEATKASLYGIVAAGSGIASALWISASLYNLLKDVSLEIFFSLPRETKDLLQDPAINMEPNVITKLALPNFKKWRLEKLKLNLCANPDGWNNDPILCNYVCPITGDFMLFPVKDKCGHYFDYRSVRGYHLDPHNASPLNCPITGAVNAIAETYLKFDKVKFDIIQRRISEIRS